MEDKLCVFLPRIIKIEHTGRHGSTSHPLLCPEAWQMQIANTLESLPPHLDDSTITSIGTAQGYLELLQIMKTDTTMRERVRNCLMQLFRSVLQSGVTIQGRTHLAVGKGFEWCVNHSDDNEQIEHSLWPLICTFGPSITSFPVFLKGLQGYIDKIFM